MFLLVLQDGENRVVVPVGLGLVGHVAITGDALRVVNPYDDPRFHPNERIATRMRNAMYVGHACMHSASSIAASTCGTMGPTCRCHAPSFLGTTLSGLGLSKRFLTVVATPPTFSSPLPIFCCLAIHEADGLVSCANPSPALQVHPGH